MFVMLSGFAGLHLLQMTNNITQQIQGKKKSLTVIFWFFFFFLDHQLKCLIGVRRAIGLILRLLH